MSCEKPPWYHESFALMDIYTAVSLALHEEIERIWESSVDKNIINKHSRIGWTPLTFASCHDHASTAKLLIEKGASTSISDFSGRTPVMIAVKHHSQKTFELLVEHGADIEARDSNGWTVLFHAVYFLNKEAVQFLLRKNCKVQVRDINCVTPLMLAEDARQEEILRLLLPYVVSSNLPRIQKPILPPPKTPVCVPSYLVQVPQKPNSNVSNKQTSQTPLGLEVSTVLSKLGLSKYTPCFRNRCINMDQFWKLTDDDLMHMGIKCLGPRKKITTFIAKGQHLAKAQLTQ